MKDYNVDLFGYLLRPVPVVWAWHSFQGDYGPHGYDGFSLERLVVAPATKETGLIRRHQCQSSH